MALNRPRRWLIAYDLREPRRIARVHRLLTKVAVPVQYSVFAARGSAAAMRQLAAQIEALIDSGVDDVRMYPIPERPLLHTIGGALLPDDALLLDAQTGLETLLGRGAASRGRGYGGARRAYDVPAACAPSTGPASSRPESENGADLREPQP